MSITVFYIGHSFNVFHYITGMLTLNDIIK